MEGSEVGGGAYDPSIVDEDVYRAEVELSAREQGTQFLVSAQIGGNCDRNSTSDLNLLTHSR